MSLEEFRNQVQDYRRRAGITQKKLAHELGLNASVLSHKLHGSDGMLLTHIDVKRTILSLARLQAITTVSEATALLALMDLKPNIFTQQEWTASLLVSPDNEAAKVLSPGLSPVIDPVPIHFNLPSPLTPLLGRAVIVGHLVETLMTPGLRLVNLTGPGGVGKTRVAIEVAHHCLSRFQDGVYFISLANLTDPELVVSEIIHQLNLKPASDTTPLATLIRYCGARELLLVLDNFEQLIAAAPLVSTLLEQSSGLKIMVTSRARLNLYGEQQIVILPLELPDLQHLPEPDQLLAQPAVALFVTRTQAVRSDFTLTEANADAVAEICVRLDGLPLALELAAARCRLFSPAALLQRLDQALDLPNRATPAVTRHQTLRDTISWSYLLLTPTEQHLFEFASLFPSGCTAEAIEAISATRFDRQAEPFDVLEGLASLLDKSLLFLREGQDTQVRFHMLETLREFAFERLIDSNSYIALRTEQARYYTHLVQAAASHLSDSQETQQIALLEAEHDNIGAILTWALPSALQYARQICASLWYFWSFRGYINEGYYWLTQSIAIPLPADARNEERADYAAALHGHGTLAYFLSDYESAARSLEAALDLRRELQDLAGIGATLNSLGNLAWDKSQLDRAQAFYEEVVAIGKTLGNKHLQANALSNLGGLLWQRDDLRAAQKHLLAALALRRELQSKTGLPQVLSNLGIVSVKLGDLDGAIIYYTEGLAIARQIGNPRAEAGVLNNLGEVALHKKDYPRAQRYFEQALTLHRSVDYLWGVSSTLCNLGSALLFQNEHDEALVVLQESLTLMRQLGDRAKLIEILECLGVTVLRLGDTLAALAYHLETLQLNLELTSNSGVGMSLACIAAALAKHGEQERAAQLWGAAHALWEQSGFVLLPAQQQRFLQELTAARAESDIESQMFIRAWRTGAEDIALVIQEALRLATTMPGTLP